MRRAFLDHPHLGPRLRTCVAALQDLPPTTAETVLGGIDAVKLRSSLTLFIAAGGGTIFIAALKQWFDGVPDGDAATPPYIGRPPILPIDQLMLSSNVFERPVVARLAFQPDLITREAEAALIARIDAVGLTSFKFQGWLGKRGTASCGWRYDFDNASFGPTEPIRDWLLPIRASAATFAGLFEHVVGISLGVAATMRFRRRKASGFDRANVPLPPRSAYHLSGDVRHHWEHSIAEMDVTRWSITFRSLSAKGLAALDR